MLNYYSQGDVVMKKIITNDEIISLRDDRMSHLLKRKEDIKKRILEEEKEVNSFIGYAHSLYVLNGYNSNDEDGKRLRTLRGELLGYCIDHIKRYKLLNIEYSELKYKIEQSKRTDDNYEKKYIK